MDDELEEDEAMVDVLRGGGGSRICASFRRRNPKAITDLSGHRYRSCQAEVSRCIRVSFGVGAGAAVAKRPATTAVATERRRSIVRVRSPTRCIRGL